MSYVHSSRWSLLHIVSTQFSCCNGNEDILDTVGVWIIITSEIGQSMVELMPKGDEKRVMSMIQNMRNFKSEFEQPRKISNEWNRIWRHRFSAFWLRSKCSICSYQLNIWYVPHWGTSILNWFLDTDEVSGACSAFVTGWPGIAVPPGSAHFLRGVDIPIKTIWLSSVLVVTRREKNISSVLLITVDHD